MKDALDASRRPLRVLFVEDSEDDAYLNARALKRAGFDIATSARVQSAAELRQRLSESDWDLVLSDYDMPGFQAPNALAILHETAADLPFIVVSGTVGEDTAVDMMRHGAHDYILKGRLARLGAAVDRELRAAETRRTQRQSEGELRDAEERNRILLAHSSDAISIIDAAGILRYVSAPIEAIIGHRPEELVGRPVGSTVCDEDAAGVAEKLGAVYREFATQAGASPVTFEARVRHKDGTLRWVESTVRNFLDDPRIAGLVCTTRDISQRRAIDEERRGRLQAELASQTKSAFLANVSHELRTPLNAIIGFSELMEQGLTGPLTPKQSAFVDNVLQAGRHLLRVVNDILDLSKVEAGKLTLNREWTTLGDVALPARETVTPLVERAGLTLEMSVADDLPAIYVDPLRLKQILLNLLSNAIKFTRPGGAVLLAVRGRGRALEIRVQDSGVGIAAENLPRLFHAFERMDGDGTVAKAEGTGLGLALTKRLVELHGGTIAAESTLGRGTTFTIVLPDVLRPERMSEAPLRLRVTSPIVLIVDDDAQASALIAQHARAAGFHPVFAQGAEDTLRIAAVERPALITLDIMMPNIDGWAILECLRHDPTTADIPAVVISVTDDRVRSLALGAVAHLTKPISRDELHDVLVSVGAPVRRMTGRNILVCGTGEDLDRTAELLAEVGCNVDRAINDTTHYDLSIVDLVRSPDVLVTCGSVAPVLGIVDEVPPSAPPDVTFVRRSDLGGPEIVRRIHDSMRPSERREDGASR